MFELAALAGGALASASAARRSRGRAARWRSPTAALERLTADAAGDAPARVLDARPRAPRARAVRRGARATSSAAPRSPRQTGRERVLLIAHGRVGRRRWSSSAASPRRSRPPRKASSARAWPATRACCCGRTARSRPRGWRPATSTAALRHAGEAAAPGHAGPTSTRRASPAGASAPRWPPPATPTAPSRVMLDAFGGPELPRVLPADRPRGGAPTSSRRSSRARRRRRRRGGARPRRGRRRARRHARTRDAVTGIARSAVLLAARARATRPRRPRPRPRAAARRRRSPPRGRGSPRAGRSRPRGDRRGAIEALVAAESAFDGFGALRRRDEAVRELRRLGHRVVRAAPRTSRRRPAHRARARDRRARRRRTHQPRGRRAARPQHAHGRGAPAQHLRQARRPLARRARARLPTRPRRRRQLASGGRTGSRCLGSRAPPRSGGRGGGADGWSQVSARCDGARGT